MGEDAAPEAEHGGGGGGEAVVERCNTVRRHEEALPNLVCVQCRGARSVSQEGKGRARVGEEEGQGDDEGFRLLQPVLAFFLLQREKGGWVA